MKSCCHKSRNMSHIHHQICADFIRDLTETLKVNGSGISAGSGNDHLRFTLSCDLQHLIIVNYAFVINAIRYDIEIFTGHIDRRTMCQVAAMIQIHTHVGVRPA